MDLRVPYAIARRRPIHWPSAVTTTVAVAAVVPLSLFLSWRKVNLEYINNKERERRRRRRREGPFEWNISRRERRRKEIVTRGSISHHSNTRQWQRRTPPPSVRVAWNYIWNFFFFILAFFSSSSPFFFPRWPREFGDANVHAHSSTRRVDSRKWTETYYAKSSFTRRSSLAVDGCNGSSSSSSKGAHLVNKSLLLAACAFVLVRACVRRTWVVKTSSQQDDVNVKRNQSNRIDRRPDRWRCAAAAGSNVSYVALNYSQSSTVLVVSSFVLTSLKAVAMHLTRVGSRPPWDSVIQKVHKDQCRRPTFN